MPQYSILTTELYSCTMLTSSSLIMLEISLRIVMVVSTESAMTTGEALTLTVSSDSIGCFFKL